jgi:uroporphyrinogen-III synthase
VTGTAPIVVNTRDEGPDGPLATALHGQGFVSMACPTIAIVPPDDLQPLRDALGRVADFEWLTFTSAHAVEAVARLPEWQSALAKGLPRVAAVGDASAERLAAEHVKVEVVPDRVGSTALADAILSAAGTLRGVRVLWPRGDLAMLTFREALERAGATVTAPIAYRTLPAGTESLAAIAAGLAENRFSAIAFCSPSSVRNLARGLRLANLSSLRGRLLVASIGPTTSAVLRELGLDPDVEAETPSMTSLAESIAARLRAATGGRS